MKIGVVGSRRYPAKGPIEKFVEALPKDAVIISGGAIGVDRSGEGYFFPGR